MNFTEILFSPTGGAKKVADAFSEQWNESRKIIDLFDNKVTGEVEFDKDDVCLIAVPSFGGRVPAVAAEKLKKIKTKGACAILVAVFGNRHIDDTLAELYDILKADGFFCIAGIEAVAEHSLMRTYAQGRPDAKDIEEIKAFSETIKNALQKGEIKTEPLLPGNHEYRSFNGVPFKPLTNENCTSCGQCVRECPVSAIPKENPKITDNDKCISCMHCIAVCPQKARFLDKELVNSMTEKVKERFAGRKQNKLYTDF